MQSPSLGRIRTADMLDDEASLQVTRYPDLEIYPCFFKTVESNTCNPPLNSTVFSARPPGSGINCFQPGSEEWKMALYEFFQYGVAITALSWQSKVLVYCKVIQND